MNARLMLLLALLAAAGCLFFPEDPEDKREAENIPPTIRITAGAMHGSMGVDYRVDFAWMGADEDGIISRYEFAVDDTSTSRAWVDTTAAQVHLTLSASQPGWYASDDTLGEWHTFYVRAVDNEEAVSTTQSRYFNTRTIAPSTRITYPYTQSGHVVTDDCLLVAWEGEDLDATNQSRHPDHYECKLIQLPSRYIEEAAIVDSIRLKENLLLDDSAPGDPTEWLRIPGGIKEYDIVDFDQPGTSYYVFCVRAVDEAGATEPVLERGENWITIYPSGYIKWRMTMNLHGYGSHTFPIHGDVWEISYPVETPIAFSWSGEPAFESANYGWDIPDPYDDRYTDPHGFGGYIGWSATDRVRVPRSFPATAAGTIHTFTLRGRLRGCSGQHEIYGTVLVRLLDPPDHTRALLVDDAKIGYGGLDQDQIHDGFVTRFTERILDFVDLEFRSLYRPRQIDPEGRNPDESTLITLPELLRYEAILWSFNVGGNGSTGLWYHEHEGMFSERRLLSSYVASGGKLFLFGNQPVSSVISPLDGGMPTRDYPKAPPQAGPRLAAYSTESFVWQFLHVRNEVVGIDQFSCYSRPPHDHQQWRDGLVQCRSTNPAYPDLVLDPAKHDTDSPADCGDQIHPPTGGIRDWEGVFYDGTYPPLDPEPGLDTLYKAVPYNWSGTPASTYFDAVIAQRYESTPADTLNDRTQGRVVLFLFQPFYFEETATHEAGRAGINWLMTGSDY